MGVELKGVESRVQWKLACREGSCCSAPTLQRHPGRGGRFYKVTSEDSDRPSAPASVAYFMGHIGKLHVFSGRSIWLRPSAWALEIPVFGP